MRFMIVSRAAELDVVDALLADVRARAGRALLVRGDPGIGKTTLLDALAERCGPGVTWCCGRAAWRPRRGWRSRRCRTC